MEDRELVRIIPETLTCYKREDERETTFSLAGEIAAESSLHYRGIYLQAVLYDASKRVLHLDDRGVDLEFGVTERIPFQWRYDVPAHLAAEATTLALKARAELFEVDLSTNVDRSQMIHAWRWRPEMPMDPPSIKNHTEGLRILFREEDDGDVRLDFLGTMSLTRGADYENMRIEVVAYDMEGHVLFREDNGVYEDWASTEEHPFQTRIHIQAALFNQVHLMTVRKLARRKAFDGPIDLAVQAMKTIES